MITSQYKDVRREGVFAQVTGRQPLNLDVGAPLAGILLRLQYTVTTGATAPTGVMFGPLLQTLQLLQRLEVVVNGQDTVWNVQPWLYASRLIQERHGTIPRGMENQINMSANQVTNVDVSLPLHFDLLRGRKRNDCAIDLRGVRACQLYATFGGTANLFGTPGATVAISNIVLTAEATYIDNVPAKDKRGNPIVFGVRQLDELNIPIVGPNNQFTWDIDQRSGVNMCSLGLFFDTPSGGTVHAGDDSGLINGSTFQGDFKIKSGSQYFESTQASFAKARWRDEFFNVTAGNGATNNPELTGYYILDLRYDGKLSTGIPTGSLDANLQLLINENYTSGNTVLYLQRESVRPLNVSNP